MQFHKWTVIQKQTCPYSGTVTAMTASNYIETSLKLNEEIEGGKVRAENLNKIITITDFLAICLETLQTF